VKMYGVFKEKYKIVIKNEILVKKIWKCKIIEIRDISSKRCSKKCQKIDNFEMKKSEMS
jgi:hypothetical protein